MKITFPFLLAGLLASRLFALEPAAIAAVAKGFVSQSGDEQYQARIELNRLIDQATLPGKGDPAAVTAVLTGALRSAEIPAEAKKYILRALGRVGTGDAVETIVTLLAGSDALLKEEARSALETIPDPKASAALEAALRKATDQRDKLGLINSLAIRKAASSVPVLAPLSIDADPEIARAAVVALAKIGGPQATASLQQASGKAAPVLKADVQMAQLLANPTDATAAARIYQDGATDAVKLAAFLVLLCEEPPAGLTPALIESAIKSDQSELRHAAIAAALQANLAPAFRAALPERIAQLPKDDRLIVLANIHLLKPAATAEKIALGLAASADEDERINALAALGKLGTKAAFEAVLQALAAREPRVNQAAATALAGMNYPAAETDLLAMLKGSNSPEKVLAVKAVLSRQIPNANAILLEIIKGSDQPASKEAMKTVYFTATIDDLRALCAAAAAATDADFKRGLTGVCAKIATRLNTPEAKELVK